MRPTYLISTKPTLLVNVAKAATMKTVPFFRRFVFVISLLIASKGYAMESSEAMKLIEAWGDALRDKTYIGALVVDAKGGFKTKSKGAYFRYDAQKKVLHVSGLVGSNLKSISKYPDEFEYLKKIAATEKITLGEGEFELIAEALFDLEASVLLLTKTFKTPPKSNDQFVTEVRWLLGGAIHWFLQRYNAVMSGRSDAELATEGKQIISTWPKRPW
jgi:hypothetical protein